jgi:hypothetical protein
MKVFRIVFECPVITRRDDGNYDARCERCLLPSPNVDTPEALADLGWELRGDGQTWCLECSVRARVPRGRPNARGVRRRRG